VSSPDELRVNDRVSIPRSELTYRATKSGGPGGQHVNTSSTRIELLWNPTASLALDGTSRAIVMDRLSARLDAEGSVRVVASDSRSQRQNRVSAEERLVELVRKALVVRRKRTATKPSRAAKAQRLDEKKRRGRTKALRGKRASEFD